MSAASSTESPHALLISSHVVFGVVGNKSSAFPLQLLGFDVDQLNSVQLSNHTGYSSFKGQVLDGDALEKIIAGLSENGLLGSYSHVLSGYVGSPTFLRRIAAAVETIRESNKQLCYVCDPVMGDHGKLYVPGELVPIYRRVVAPLATLLTPNQTELELLASPDVDAEGTTGRITPIKEPKDAFAAMDVLHARGTKAVVVTSSALPLGQDESMLLLASCPWEMVKDDCETLFKDLYPSPTSSCSCGKGAGASSSCGCASSASASASSSSHARFSITIPKLSSVFTGTGDLTAALLLAHLHRHPHSLVTACVKALATVQAVCKRTMAHYESCSARLKEETSGACEASWISKAAGSSNGQLGKGIVPAFNELRLIQSKSEIENPPFTSSFDEAKERLGVEVTVFRG